LSLPTIRDTLKATDGSIIYAQIDTYVAKAIQWHPANAVAAPTRTACSGHEAGTPGGAINDRSYRPAWGVGNNLFIRFQVCITGPGSRQDDPACALALLDADRDVDQADLALFCRWLSGANIPVNLSGEP
jgi:hypothetical protein